MTSFLADTSCMVAAVSTWHANHRAARLEIEQRLDRGEILCSAWPALMETYSVLTRLPAPHRLESGVALTVVRANFVEGVKAVALTGRDYARLLNECEFTGTRGGRVYDAVIAACARKAGASVLLTFNQRDFETLSEDRFTVVVPGT